MDTTKEYQFDSVLNSQFDRKKTLSLLRKNANESAKKNDKKNTKGGANNGGGGGGYLSTQFLMETSLSQDVNRFDFNDPIEAYSNYSTTNVDSIASSSPHDSSSSIDVDENAPFSPNSPLDVSMFFVSCVHIKLYINIGDLMVINRISRLRFEYHCMPDHDH